MNLRPRHLLLSTLFLLGCVFSQVQSTELLLKLPRQISQANNIRYVESVGYGLDIDAATRNAAENALKSVVGSFMSSQTLIKKRSTISDGIARYVKKIDVDLVDYSQGFIRSMEIYSIEKEDDLFAVAAKVSIMPHEFKTFIVNLASDSSRIKESLLTEAVAENQKQINRLKVLDNLLRPIAAGEAIAVISQDPIRLKDAPRYSRISDGHRVFISKRPLFYPSTTIIVPFTIKIKDSYMQQIYSTLDRVSDSKRSFRSGFKRKTLRNTDEDIYIGITDYETGRRIRYGFEGLAPYARKHYKEHRGLDGPGYWYSCDVEFGPVCSNPLVVKVVGSKNENISSISIDNLFTNPHHNNEINVQCDPQEWPSRENINIDPCNRDGIYLYNVLSGGQKNIYRSKKFFVILNLPVEKSTKASKVKIGFGQI